MTDLPLRSLLKGSNPPKRISQFVYQLFYKERKSNASNDNQEGEFKKKISKFPENQSLLLKYVNDDQVFCLNESSTNNCKNVFSANEKYLESDGDAQLLLNVPFKQTLKIHSILIESSQFEKAPKTISLYINRNALLFEDCEEIKPTHQIVLTEENLLEGSFVVLPPLLFNSVNSLSFFVLDNQKSSNTTRIDRIKIFGTSISGPKNLDNLKRNNNNRRRNNRKK